MKKRLSVLLFCVGVAFWPLFAVLTILEEKGGVTCLRTGSERFWMPVAALALISAVAAPLVADRPFVKKSIGVVCAVLAYAAAYGVVVLVGVSLLGWDD